MIRLEVDVDRGVDVAVLPPAPAGTQIQRARGGIERKSLDAPVVLEIMLNLAGGVALDRTASWLYDWLKAARARRVRIRGREVPIERAALEESLRRELPPISRGADAPQ